MQNKKIKKITCAVFLCFIGNFFAYADMTKSQILSQMSGTEQPSNTNGGLVNNNVNYNNQNNNPTPQNNQPLQSGSNLVNNSQNYNNVYNNSTPKKKKVVAKKKVKKIDINSLATQKIDITFNNDVGELPNTLKQYDPQLTILPNLGKKSSQTVSFDLQSVGIDQIVSMIQTLTGGAVRLIYDSDKDSIRLSYITVNKAGNSPVSQSENWREGKGKPQPIMTADGVLLFPYGQYEPTVICKPQQVCDIRFQAGENILDAVMGDTTRWMVQGVVSGIGANQVKHIILKPQYPDLNTNMIVTTDKGRVYNLRLLSSEKNYISAIGWYYPQEINDALAQKFKDQQMALGGINQGGSNPNNINTGSLTSANGIKLNAQSTMDNDNLPVLDLDFRYEISGDKVIWKPLRVFNDGVHTYIEVDQKALNVPSPAFMVYDENSGSYEMVNYRQKGNYYIVDQMFNVGILIYDVGRNQQKVTIKHILDTSKENKNWLY